MVNGPLKGLRAITSGPVDTGNELLNAIQRGQFAQQRVAQQNQADEDAGYDQPWWAKRRLNTLGGWSAGDQTIEGQNEIADTGQRTGVGFDGAAGPHNSPSFQGLLRSMGRQKQQELSAWGQQARKLGGVGF